jgi:hypothetical protein
MWSIGKYFWVLSPVLTAQYPSLTEGVEAKHGGKNATQQWDNAVLVREKV